MKGLAKGFLMINISQMLTESCTIENVNLTSKLVCQLKNFLVVRKYYIPLKRYLRRLFLDDIFLNADRNYYHQNSEK